MGIDEKRRTMKMTKNGEYHKGNRETANDLGCLFVREVTMQKIFHWDEIQFVHRAGFQFVGEGNVSDTREKGNDLGFIELGKMEIFFRVFVHWAGSKVKGEND
jgi:hypothetical protein